LLSTRLNSYTFPVFESFAPSLAIESDAHRYIPSPKPSLSTFPGILMDRFRQSLTGSKSFRRSSTVNSSTASSSTASPSIASASSDNVQSSLGQALSPGNSDIEQWVIEDPRAFIKHIRDGYGLGDTQRELAKKSLEKALNM
jgi:hypothetical protein